MLGEVLGEVLGAVRSEMRGAVQVRRIRPDEGLRLKELRLRALREAPYAFTSTLAQAEQYPDNTWHERARAGSAGREQVVFIAEEAAAAETPAAGNDAPPAWMGMVGGLVGEAAPESVGPISLISLTSMWVDPAVRQTGAGRALVEAVLDWARTHGATHVRLSVYRGNDAAARLYEHCGFAFTGEVEASSRDPDDAMLLMERTI